MPVRAPSVCPHCNRAHTKSEPCEAVQRMERERKARFDQKRPSARQRGYDAEWERESKAFLAVYSSCRRCGKQATLVDHITPIRVAPHRRMDRTNWQPLCTPCHSGAKQRQDRRN